MLLLYIGVVFELNPDIVLIMSVILMLMTFRTDVYVLYEVRRKTFA